MLHCVQVGGGDRSGCPAQPRRTRRAAPKPMRWTGPSMGRVAAPEQGAVRRCPCAGPRRACGDVRGVCPILVPVNCLQKEHTA